MNPSEFYKEITKDCPFNTDPTEIFYYAEQEHLNTNLLARNCIEIDIASAFPSLCKFIFGEHHPFVQKIYEFEDKFERNKFIAINLTHKDYNLDLKTLNSWCKFIILGYVYNNFNNISILEYKKDGIIFNGSYKYEDANDEFNKYIEDLIGIKFHVDIVHLYIRFNKTSIFKYTDKIVIKGKYKSPPKFITDYILPQILDKNFSIELLSSIKYYYSDLFYELINNAKLGYELNEYYRFNNKFIQNNGDLTHLPSNPKNILMYFLYPIITLLRLEK